MDLHEQRMQCLKMAFELGGKPEAVLSAAQQLLDFISGPPPAAAEPYVAEIPSVEATAAQEAVPDPIAACGTALVMEEGGELADAVPPSEPATASDPEAPVAAQEPEVAIAESSEPADAAVESAPAEMTEAPAEEAPAEELAADAGAAGTLAGEPPAETADAPAAAASEAPAEATAPLN